MQTPPIWIADFKESLAAEFAGRPALATLATVAVDADAGEVSPAARTVVCRDVADDGSLWFVSDARSEKNRQLRHTSRAETVFWLASLRAQFRISGAAEVIDATSGGPDRVEAWRRLSDASRALFFWPDPGGPRVADAAAFPEAADAGAGPPDSFEVVVVRATVVDRLDLTGHPHRRRRWRRDNGWVVEELNP